MHGSRLWCPSATAQILGCVAVSIQTLPLITKTAQRRMEEFSIIPLTDSIVMAVQAASTWTDSSSAVLHCS
jgi:hypothetical protein